MRAIPLILAVILAASAPGASPQSFDAVIFTTSFNSPPPSGGLYLLDTTTGKVTTQYSFPERNRGGVLGPDGKAYLGLWRTNAVASVDLTTGALVDIIKDSSNTILGAPYQLAPDYENVGGFGLCVIDGNQPPAPAPAGSRNTARVDFATRSFSFDGWFPNTEMDQSDFFPNLFNPGSFVGIPRPGDAAASVNDYPLAQSPPQALGLTTLATLSFPGYMDACWAEDGRIYVWGNQYVGLHEVDIRAGTSTVVPVSGVYAPGFASLWNEAWEKPGMKAYLVSGTSYVVYSLDLLARPIIAIRTQAVLNVPITDFPVAAREAEEAQLSSWWTSAARPGERNFHLNFGRGHAGETAILVPSLVGLAAVPAMLGGLEIYLTVDATSLIALSGFLPYSPVASLDPSGQADVVWRGLGARLGISAYWQAITLRGTTFTDASNLIHVNL